MADTDTQLDLKKRARRRLVGAMALALLAAVILPMVMDREPKQADSEIQIRIPSQEGSNYAARPIQSQEPASSKPIIDPEAEASLPQGSANISANIPSAAPIPSEEARPKPDQSKPVKKPDTQTAQAKPEQKPEAHPEPKPVPKPDNRHDDAARAAALLEGKPLGSSSYVIQLGVFKDASNAKSVLAEAKAAGFNSFVETVGGDKTRVKAGPFESREAAEQAASKLRKAGLSAVIQPRS
ncbi:MAG: SPOR domain-containing protein [Betaproteobacteria bacterium]|nr:SPOR domain-containing protein [Betaproteobacteria bacterium]